MARHLYLHNYCRVKETLNSYKYLKKSLYSVLRYVLKKEGWDKAKIDKVINEKKNDDFSEDLSEAYHVLDKYYTIVHLYDNDFNSVANGLLNKKNVEKFIKMYCATFNDIPEIEQLRKISKERKQHIR